MGMMSWQPVEGYIMPQFSVELEGFSVSLRLVPVKDQLQEYFFPLTSVST